MGYEVRIAACIAMDVEGRRTGVEVTALRRSNHSSCLPGPEGVGDDRASDAVGEGSSHAY